MIPSPNAYPPNYEERYQYKRKKSLNIENPMRESTAYRSPWEDIHPLLTHLQSHCTKLTAHSTKLSSKIQKMKRSVNTLDQRVDHLEDWKKYIEISFNDLKFKTQQFQYRENVNQKNDLESISSDDSNLLNEMANINYHNDQKFNNHKYLKELWRIWQTKFEVDFRNRMESTLEEYIENQVEKKIESRLEMKFNEQFLEQKINKIFEDLLEKKLNLNFENRINNKIEKKVKEIFNQETLIKKKSPEKSFLSQQINDLSTLSLNNTQSINSIQDIQKQIKLIKKKHHHYKDTITKEISLLKDLLQKNDIRDSNSENNIEMIQKNVQSLQSKTDSLISQIDLKLEQESAKLDIKLLSLQKLQDQFSNNLDKNTHSNIFVDISNKIEDRLQKQLHQNLNLTNDHIIQLFREQEAETKLAIKQLIEKNKEFLVRTAAALKKKVKRSNSINYRNRDSLENISIPKSSHLRTTNLIGENINHKFINDSSSTITSQRNISPIQNKENKSTIVQKLVPKVYSSTSEDEESSTE